jgi:hypothetical protein
MIVDTIPRAALAPTPDLAAPRAWSDAEFFDEHLPDGFVLRALVCLREGGEFHWTVSFLEQDRGELISAGVEKTAALARRAATAEIAKCLENGMA